MMRTFLWTLRRELWENRWLYRAPLGMATVLVLGFAAYARLLPAQMVAAQSLEALPRHAAMTAPYDVVAGFMMIAGLLIAVVYCVDALYSERRDRSVLLWKSLPVSDATTVLAKLSIPVLVLPIIVWASTVAIHLTMMLISTAVLAANGQSPALLWTQVHLLSMSLSLLNHLVMGHGLIAAPLFGWLLLMSAWAPRAPFLWAFLPPLAAAFLERVAFGTTHFAEFLLARIGGGPGAMPSIPGGSMIDAVGQRPLLQVLVAPSLWMGLAVTGLMLAAMARVRRATQPA